MANDDATTNYRREWNRRAAADDESIWGQRSDEGIEYRTLAGDDEIERGTTMHVPTNDWSGKGGESRLQRELRRSHDSVRRATTIAGGGQQCNNQPTAGATKGAAAAVVIIIIAALTVAVAVVVVVVVVVADFAVAVAVAVAIDTAVSSAPLLVDCCMCPPLSLCRRHHCHFRHRRHCHRSRCHRRYRCRRRCCHRPRCHHRHSCHRLRRRLRSHRHRDIELPSLKSRLQCPIDVGIEVNLFLFDSIRQSSATNRRPPRNFLQASALIWKPNLVYDARPATVRSASYSAGSKQMRLAR